MRIPPDELHLPHLKMKWDRDTAVPLYAPAYSPIRNAFAMICDYGAPWRINDARSIERLAEFIVAEEGAQHGHS